MKRAIYYHTNWSCYGRNFQIKDLPEHITDIAYAFYNIDQTGNIFTGDAWADTDKRYIGADSVAPPDSWNEKKPFYGNFNQLKKLQDSGRKLNIQLSIGGWTWSTHFSTAMATEGSRTKAIKCLIDLFKKYPIFNGVSLDWEYLSDNGVNYGNGGNSTSKDDAKNFIIFLQQLRANLNSNGLNNYVISMCACADPNKAIFPIKQVAELLDELHVMTYDFHDGNWGEKVCAHQTNPRKSSHGVYSCEEAVDFYINSGVPASKIFLGGAFYSRGFANTDGLGKSASGGSPDMTWEKGVVDYKALPMSGAKEFFDDEAKANYSYDPVRRVFNSYDGVESTIEKCRIIYEKNLAGIIIWESSGNVFLIICHSQFG